MKIIAKYDVIGAAEVLCLIVYLYVLFTSYYESGEDMEQFGYVFTVVCPVVAVIIGLARVWIVYCRVQNEPERFMARVREVERDEGRSPKDRNSTIEAVRWRMVIGNLAASILVILLWAVWLIVRSLELRSDTTLPVAPFLMWMALVALLYVALSFAARLALRHKD